MLDGPTLPQQGRAKAGHQVLFLPSRVKIQVLGDSECREGPMMTCEARLAIPGDACIPCTLDLLCEH